jgi:hypothetical protein
VVTARSFQSGSRHGGIALVLRNTLHQVTLGEEAPVERRLSARDGSLGVTAIVPFGGDSLGQGISVIGCIGQRRSRRAVAPSTRRRRLPLRTCGEVLMSPTAPTSRSRHSVERLSRSRSGNAAQLRSEPAVTREMFATVRPIFLEASQRSSEL